MKFTTAQATLMGMIGCTAALPSLHRPPLPDFKRAAAVKAVFKTAWDGYYKYAYPNDNLHPVDNGYDNDRNGWGATTIDGLSTAILMGHRDIVNTMLKHVPTVDFTTTKVANDQISVFETTIRYLGGLISAYEMLNGPYRYLVEDPKLIKPLIQQAVKLADSLAITFSTPSGMSDGYIYLNPEPRISGASSINVAEAGTLVLEWTRLSDITGNQTYAKLAQKCEAYAVNPTGAPEAFPGLIGTFFSTQNGTMLDSNGGWNGGMDSFYEYLIKMYLYDPKAFSHYKDRWIAAADSTIKHLGSHPTTRKELTFLNSYQGSQVYPASGHLASFAGGNFILAGILLREQKYKDFGLALTDSYFQTYNGSASGIGPEGFRWVSDALPADSPLNSQPPADQAEHYKETGFWADSTQYILRPETMESMYYAYRLTGDKKYQDMAWQAFSAIAKVCRAGSAYSGINDTDEKDGGGFDNYMESFFLAELMKYSYLIFAPDGPVQVRGDGLPNEWVFNTEAHPVKIRHSLF